jgi:hypothetical protein
LGAVLSPRRLAAGGAVLAVCTAVLAAGCGAERVSAAPESAFPTPPPGSTVYARQLGNDALALAVVPGDGKALTVEAQVIGRQRNGVRGLHVSFVVAGKRKAARACGAGCYRASFSPSRPPKAVDVTVAGRRRMPWHVVLPPAWPPRDASALVDRAARTWRALDSLTFDESLASGINIGVRSTWRVQAPDRVAYQVRGGWAGIVIGARRWDRAPGATKWQESAQTRLHQPVPPWQSVTDAHVLGNVTYAGRPATRASFFDPGSPAWFTIVVDRKTHRTLELDMVTNAHFMHDVFRGFDSTPAIVPPD